MKKLIGFMRKHIAIARGLVVLCGAFFACFAFPIRLGEFPLGWLTFYVLIGGFGAVAEGFVGVYGPGWTCRVWLMTMISTVLGLIGRYLLEFGEVSNTYNFMPENVAVFLLTVPLGTAVAYYFLSRKKRAGK